jgi:hypothetical protein
VQSNTAADKKIFEPQSRPTTPFDKPIKSISNAPKGSSTIFLRELPLQQQGLFLGPHLGSSNQELRIDGILDVHKLAVATDNRYRPMVGLRNAASPMLIAGT